MFGIKSSGCFILGIIMGFILALALGGVCVLFFNPQAAEKPVREFYEFARDEYGK